MAAPNLKHFDYDANLLQAAARNWRSREEQRQENKIKVAIGQLTEVETKERIAANQQYHQEARLEARQYLAEAERRGAPDLFQERVIGDRDFLGIEFLEMAAAVSRFVGRVHIRTQPGRTLGYGTGFVVSPRLLLTNNHVLPSPETARHSLVEFDYQKNRFGQPLPVVAYALEPQTFFLTDRRLDFTLVAVSEQSAAGPRLSNYAWVRLRPESGKALIGDALNIIQHPRGEMKQLVLRSNRLVDNFEDFVHYESDTDPGSSGSPVFSDFWHVVALHHSGVPKTNAAGAVLDVDGRVWRDGRDDPDRIAWVGNEGIRVSSLVRAIEKSELANATQRDLRRQLLELEPPHPFEVAGAPKQTPVVAGTPTRGGSVTLTIPLHITVSLGPPLVPATAQPQVPAPTPVISAPAEVPKGEPAPPKKDRDRQPASGQEAILEAARAEFERLPGVLGVELGYEFKDGWITDRRALVVTVRKRGKGGKTVAPELPDEFQGLPVQTTGPALEDLVSLGCGRAVAEAVFAEAISAAEITYQPPAGARLEKITDTMRVVAHLSPDAGWPQLEKFLAGTEKSMTVGMYDFGAKHILEALLKHAEQPSFKKLALVMQKGESLGEGTKADDLHDDEVVEQLRDAFSQRFKFSWVKIGAVNGWVASSYHIKVAVRDGKAFWLSSGNWQSSNQPKVNPLDGYPQKKDLLKRFNREWHAIVEHEGLARKFETFLLHDGDNNEGADGREEFVLPDVLLPLDFFAREAAEAPDSWKYFAPFDQKRQFTVTPLLTPDNYHTQVLELIRSAENELLIQNQTFNAPKKKQDDLRELVEAVLEKQRRGVNVRIIFRLLNPSEARKNLSALKDMGFDMDSIRVQKNCHTKGIIVDGKRVLLGSQNWSNHGVSINRDASLLFDDEGLAAYFREVFEHDWLSLADKDIGPEDEGIELATSLDVTPAGMVRLTWKDYMEMW